MSLLIIILSSFGSWIIAFGGVENTFLLMEIMLRALQIDELQRELILASGRLLISMLPMTVSVLGNVKMYTLVKESKKLYAEEIDYLCKKMFEQKKPQIQELLENAERLPRSELMKILNMTKDQLMKIEKTKKVECKTSDELALDYLQSGLEDMLFPSVIDSEKGYSRVRKK